MIGLPFEVVVSRFQEPSHSERLVEPIAFAEELAIEKGREVFERLGAKKMVLSADTIGILDDLVLEKPKDKDDARRMLRLMSGRKHVVVSSVALFVPGEVEPTTRSVRTEVVFKVISAAELEWYLDAEEYIDKSAAYAIQGKASLFIDSFYGDYFNVMGLPIRAVVEMMKKWLLFDNLDRGV